MTREQYDDQKRRLAEQHRALMAMLESAHQTQIQALDMVWRMLSGEVPSFPGVAAAPAAARPQAVAPAARQRRGPHELDEEVAAVLPRLPETFTVSDVCGLLGYAPNRGSLYRALQKLKLGGQLAIDFAGSGTQPALYRKLGAEQESFGS
jgi:hypothetical protein